MQGKKSDVLEAFWNTELPTPSDVSTESLIDRLSGNNQNRIVPKTLSTDDAYLQTDAFKDTVLESPAVNSDTVRKDKVSKPSLREQLAARTAQIQSQSEMIEIDPSDFALTDSFREDTPINDSKANYLFQIEPTVDEINELQQRVDNEPYEYLRKILNTMHPVNKSVYYSQVDKFGKPTGFDTLLICMAALRERVAIIPVSMRDAVFTCLFTKYVNVASSQGMDPDKLYKHFYNCLPKISEHSKFLPSLQTKLEKQLSHSPKRVKQRQYEMEFNIRCIIHFLNSVSR